MAPMVKSLGLVSACVASILVPLVLATNAAHSDETFTPTSVMNLPAASNPLQSFDISYVDVATHSYLLADRSNKAIDYFDTRSNSFVKFLIPTASFAGVVASPTNSSGPNGVLLVTGVLAPRSPGCTVACGPTYRNGKPVNMVWGTDAPTPGSSGTSSIKVLDLDNGGTITVLNTLGVRRSDELCQVLLPDPKNPNVLVPDPKNPYVLVANDDPLDNFLTIWRWDNFRFVQKISLNGTDSNAQPYNTAAGGTHNAANGIEQCKFNPRNGYFYLSVPATQGTPITSLNNLVGGTKYTNGTYSNVALTGGTGAGATANITVASTQILTLATITSGGAYSVPGTYSGVALTGGGSGATANITVGAGTGIASLHNTVGGSAYNNGTYSGVALTGGTGSGATANITVASLAVTTVTLVNPGTGYVAGDTLSAASASIGGGSGFTTQVNAVGGPVNAVTLVNGGTGYAAGNTLSATASSLGGSSGFGFSIKVATIGGPVTGVTVANPGYGYTNGDTLSAASASIGGGTGFSIQVATVGTGTDDGFVLKISLPVMTATQTVPTKYAKVVAAYDVPSSGTLGGCIAPAGLSIGPSKTSPNPYQAGTVGYIALGCGKTGTASLVIDDNFDTSSVASVTNGQGTDETWYDWFGSHFFFAQSNDPTSANCVPTVVTGCPGLLSIEDAGGTPPTGSQEDGDGGSQGLDPAAPTGTGSHSVAVYPGTCVSPARTSQVYVPTRSNLSTPNNTPTICSNGGGSDSVGCIAVFTTPLTCGGP
jgi:hypothetical protein